MTRRVGDSWRSIYVIAGQANGGNTAIRPNDQVLDQTVCDERYPGNSSHGRIVLRGTTEADKNEII